MRDFPLDNNTKTVFRFRSGIVAQLRTFWSDGRSNNSCSAFFIFSTRKNMDFYFFIFIKLHWLI